MVVWGGEPVRNVQEGRNNRLATSNRSVCFQHSNESDICFIDGADVVAVKLLQRRAVVFVVGHGSTPSRWDDQSRNVSNDVLTAYRQEKTKSLRAGFDARPHKVTRSSKALGVIEPRILIQSVRQKRNSIWLQSG